MPDNPSAANTFTSHLSPQMAHIFIHLNKDKTEDQIKSLKAPWENTIKCLKNSGRVKMFLTLNDTEKLNTMVTTAWPLKMIH